MAHARLYIRRSDDDQSGFSPEAQDREDRRWCAENGHTVVGVYIDDDLSGKREDRSAFQRLLADAKADPGSIVVVHKFDRLARDTEVLLRVVYKELLPRDVRVESVLERIDPYTPIGKMMLTLSGGVSTYHVDNLATEVSKGYREKFERGGWIGPLPLGYESRFDLDSKGERIKGTGRAVFSPDAPTVRTIFELYVTGNHSDITLAEEMNARGLTALHKGRRVPFQRDTIDSILSNPFYIGKVTYKGEERDGAHEPLIHRDIWDQVQMIRTRRARRRGGKVLVRGPGGLLTELAYCGRCGARLWWNQGDKPQGYYICGQRRRFGVAACDATMIMATKIEPLVLDVLRGLTILPPLRDAVLALVQQRLTEATPSHAQTITAIEGQLEQLKDLYQLGDLPREDYLKRREQLQRQLRSHSPSPARVLDMEHAVHLLSNLPALIEAANASQQRALLQQVFTTIWLEKGAVTAIRPAPAYALFVEALADRCLWRPRRGSSLPGPHPPPFPRSGAHSKPRLIPTWRCKDEHLHAAARVQNEHPAVDR